MELICHYKENKTETYHFRSLDNLDIQDRQVVVGGFDKKESKYIMNIINMDAIEKMTVKVSKDEAALIEK